MELELFKSSKEVQYFMVDYDARNLRRLYL